MTVNEIGPPYGNFTRRYTVANGDEPRPNRSVSGPLSDRDLERTDAEGYIVLRRFISAEQLTVFSDAVDIRQREVYGPSTSDTYRSGRFGGQYLRDLHDYSSPAWQAVLDSGVIGVARTLLGPRIVMRSFSARICHPNSKSSTEWHTDQRSDVLPHAPWFTPGHTATVIVYLDVAGPDSGMTEVIPRSHRFGSQPPTGDDATLPGERVRVHADPGDLIVFHGALWHRATPTVAIEHPRRILNLQFAPSWAKSPAFEARTDHPAWEAEAVRADHDKDSEILELLGLAGYM